MLCGYFDLGRSCALSHSLKQLRIPFAPTQRAQRLAEVCVCQAKKGSKKKAPKSKAAKTSIEQSAEAFAVPRVDPSKNVSVRRQQQWAKTKKAMESNTGKQKYKQSYRKEKLDPEEQAEEDLIRAEAAAEAEKAYRMGQKESLRSLRDKKDDPNPPTLLIDGYNILKGYRAYLKKHKPKHPLATAKSLEDQRGVFHMCVRQYIALRGTKCVLVYDAMRARRDPSGRPPKPERTVLPEGIDVVWVRDQIADYWIMKEVQERKDKYRAPYVCVATDDREIQNDVGWSSPNIYPISGQTMIDDFTEAAQLSDIKLEQTMGGPTYKSKPISQEQFPSPAVVVCSLDGEDVDNMTIRSKKRPRESLMDQLQRRRFNRALSKI